MLVVIAAAVLTLACYALGLQGFGSTFPLGLEKSIRKDGSHTFRIVIGTFRLALIHW